ncbi:MAG: winged helix-turn-helix transcriptional regulator [Clostridiales bacterium]|nr:winged helix-turn-helix transcriptional regulator [Clostridiales bacterium]
MGKTTLEQRKHLAKRFEACQPILSALGDENRQLIIKLLMERCGEGGLRVGSIQKNTNISRSAVSHHLKVLKNAGIIIMRKEGTMNFYCLDAESNSIREVIDFWKDVEEIMKSCSQK